MTFWLTSVDETGQLREFRAHLTELTEGLNLVNDVVAMGHVLLRVRLLDGDKSIDLPIDAFTGDSFSDALQQLEQQWQAILQLPATSQGATRQLRRHLVERQLVLCEQRIVSCELVISRLTLLVERAWQAKRPAGNPITRHYELIIEKYDREISRIYQTRHQLQHRLE